MKRSIFLLIASLSMQGIWAQGPRPMDIGASPQKVGDAGVVWYVTWETATQEAKRSGKPIFFMAAAAQCNGISGVF